MRVPGGNVDSTGRAVEAMSGFLQSVSRHKSGIGDELTSDAFSDEILSNIYRSSEMIPYEEMTR